MKAWNLTVALVTSAIVSVAGADGRIKQDTNPVLLAQGTQQDLKGMERSGQRDDMTTMSTAQQAQYRSEYQAAKAKWSALTPKEKDAAIAAARTRKLSDLTAMELVGQRDDMQRETAAMGARDKTQADAAKARWDKLTPAEKQATRRSAWQKKRADLDEMERVGQRDDSYVLPY